MANKKFIIILIATVLALAACFSSLLHNLSLAKQVYQRQLYAKIDSYMQQQNYILQRVADHMLAALQVENYIQVAQYINAYEELIYSLAKQGQAVPVSLYFVSLTAPQQIIGSIGAQQANVLAADEEYYMRVVEDPDVLAISKLYIRQDMPDYPMFNLGLGIFDRSGKYYGQLDLKLAQQAWYEFIAADLNNDAKLFAFKMTDGNLIRPQVYWQTAVLWTMSIQYIFWRMCAFAVCLGSVIGLYNIRQRFKAQAVELHNANKQLAAQQQTIKQLEQAQELQQKYGKLLITARSNPQMIDLHHLLTEVTDLNAHLAAERGVQLKVPQPGTELVRFYAKQLPLLQVLSGMLYAILQQLNRGSHLEVSVISLHNQQQQYLKFIFKDNGFYQHLQDTELAVSSTDIRCQGWHNICTLLEAEGWVLEHEHVAYKGNTISLLIPYRVEDNVVQIEKYL